MMGLTNWPNDERPPQPTKDTARPEPSLLGPSAQQLRQIAARLDTPEVGMQLDAKYLRVLADQLDALSPDTSTKTR